jgi:hypothetical protein
VDILCNEENLLRKIVAVLGVHSFVLHLVSYCIAFFGKDLALYELSFDLVSDGGGT